MRVVILGTAPARGVEEGEMRAAGGAAAVAGLVEEALRSGLVVRLETEDAQIGAPAGVPAVASLLVETGRPLRIGRYARAGGVENPQAMAGRRPATVAGRSIEIEGAGERDRLVEPLAAAPEDELDLLPGMPLKERAFQAAGIVHRDAVDRLDEIAGSQPGAGGRARRFEILEDRSPESVLAPERVYRAAGRRPAWRDRPARSSSPRSRGPGAGRGGPTSARPRAARW